MGEHSKQFRLRLRLEMFNKLTSNDDRLPVAPIQNVRGGKMEMKINGKVEIHSELYTDMMKLGTIAPPGPLFIDCHAAEFSSSEAQSRDCKRSAIYIYHSPVRI
jgi:hypothetical protein